MLIKKSLIVIVSLITIMISCLVLTKQLLKHSRAAVSDLSIEMDETLFERLTQELQKKHELDSSDEPKRVESNGL